MSETPTEKRRVPCTCYSRIVGYITPYLSDGHTRWNPGKEQERQERRTFDVGRAVEKALDNKGKP